MSITMNHVVEEVDCCWRKLANHKLLAMSDVAEDSPHTDEAQEGDVFNMSL